MKNTEPRYVSSDKFNINKIDTSRATPKKPQKREHAIKKQVLRKIQNLLMSKHQARYYPRTPQRDQIQIPLIHLILA